MITLSTIGFGDLVPSEDPPLRYGKVNTLFYIDFRKTDLKIDLNYLYALIINFSASIIRNESACLSAMTNPIPSTKVTSNPCSGFQPYLFIFSVK